MYFPDLRIASKSLPRKIRLALLYAGPAIYIEKDIARLLAATKQTAYRQGYTAGIHINEEPIND